MKHFNPQFETIITSNLLPVDSQQETEDGAIVPHKRSVEYLEFYTPLRQGEEVVYVRTICPKLMILSLAKQIEEIEKEVVDHPFDSLPF